MKPVIGGAEACAAAHAISTEALICLRIRKSASPIAANWAAPADGSVQLLLAASADSS